MSTNKRKERLDLKNFDEWLRSTGFLLPTNDLELARFNKLYADYDFKLKDVFININSIIKGNICSCPPKVFSIREGIELDIEIEELKMVARKGQAVPKRILDKMTKKHRKNNDDEKE